MIVWNWLIWKALKKIDSDEYIFFASGVSDSKHCTEVDCTREINLLREYIKIPNKKIIYFSSCSIYDISLSEEAYIQHKLNIESIIQKESSNYLIVRIWNIVWEWWNPRTIINFLYNSIIAQKSIEIWGWAKRNILDVDHLIQMLDFYLKDNNKIENKIININNPNSYSILEVVKSFEKQLWKQWKYIIKNKWDWIDFNTEISKSLFNSLSIDTEIYLDNIIKKYYLWNKQL